MFPPIPLVAVDPFDEHSHEILREFDFGTDFDFGQEFDFSQEFSFDGGGAWSVGSFDYDAVSVEYSDDGSTCRGCRRGQHRRQR
jgi:hypothetical protein